MKTAIVYYSTHHQNTKKLVDAIAAAHDDVDLFDITGKDLPDLTAYDRIGFASGIYFSKFQKDLLQFVQNALPEGKQVFFLYTCGAEKKGYTKAIAAAAAARGAVILGEYGCPGFDTYGPFKLIGGIAKGHPDEAEIANAVKFYEGL